MARPSRCRKICFEPTYDSFIPEGISNGEKIILTLDEYEVIRLIDLNKLTHEQASKQMNISRTTVSEIYEMARYSQQPCTWSSTIDFWWQLSTLPRRTKLFTKLP